MQTFIPAREAARAMPRPMPSEEAVIYATLPFRCLSGAACETDGSGGGGGRGAGGWPRPEGGRAGWALAYWLTPKSVSRLMAPVLTTALSCRNLRRSSAKRSVDGAD